MKRNTQIMATGLLVLLLVTLAAAPAALAKKPWEKIKIPELNEIKMPAYERVELDNGMILYLAEDHKFPLVDLSATIEVGDIFEPSNKLGLAGMTGEVMRTGGTTNISGDEIDALVEAKGMAVETFIGGTSGGAFLSCLKEDTQMGLDLLADILRNPAFPEDKIKLSKEGQKAGISRRNDDPGSIAGREMSKIIYGAEHPLARHPEYDTIASVTRQDMVNFHKTWFGPNRMYLVVLGDFDSADMIKKIETAFAGWPQVTTPLPADPEIPDFPRTVNVVDKSDLTQSTVYMAHKGIRADNENYAGLVVANRILGGGFGDRLFNEVRSRRGMAYSVGSTAGTGLRYPGMFYAYTMTKSGTTQEATEVIIGEIQKFIDEGITDDELKAAKDGILNSEVFSYDSKREILGRMVTYERYGYEPDFLQKYQAAVKNMTKEQVQTAAANVWKPEKLSILAVGGYEEFDGDMSTFGTVNMVDITIPEPELEIPDATSETLEEGRKLMMAMRDASGGAQKIKGIKSYKDVSKMDATIQGMPMTFVTTKTVVYPGLSHTLVKTPFGDQTVVTGEDAGWMESAMGSQDITGDDLVAAKNELKTDMLGILRTLEDVWCQALDPKEIDGVVCNPVYVTVGDDYKIFYLTQDNLIHMIQSPGNSPMTGAPVTQKVFVDEYKKIDGLNMPSAMRLTYDDELFGNIVVESFEINPKVDMGLFTK